MISVSQALDILLESFTKKSLLEEEISLNESLNHTCSREIKAPWEIPIGPTSIKDGIAVRYPVHIDTEYSIVGTSFAGDSGNIGIQKFNENICVKIATGGLLPPSFDTVIQIEDCRVEGKSVYFTSQPRKGLDVRLPGSDITKDKILIKQGERISAAHIGVLATFGISKIFVHRKPKVAILSTGDELVDHDHENKKLPPGKIFDSNRPMLFAALSQVAVVQDLGIVSDQEGQKNTTWLNKIIDSESIDVVVTSGAVSVGEKDFIRETLVNRHDTEILVQKLFMKPGKPCLVAKCNRKTNPLIVFGLPGNPVSSIVTCELLVKPVLRLITGVPVAMCRPPSLLCTLEHDIALDNDRPEFHRATAHWSHDGKLLASSTGFQRSSALLSMVGTVVFLELPSATQFGNPIVKAGTLCKAIAYSDSALSDIAPPQERLVVFHLVLDADHAKVRQAYQTLAAAFSVHTIESSMEILDDDLETKFERGDVVYIVQSPKIIEHFEKRGFRRVPGIEEMFRASDVDHMINLDAVYALPHGVFLVVGNNPAHAAKYLKLISQFQGSY